MTYFTINGIFHALMMYEISYIIPHTDVLVDMDKKFQALPTLSQHKMRVRVISKLETRV